MISRRFSTSIRSLIYCSLVFALTLSVLIFINRNLASNIVSAQDVDEAAVSAPAAIFPGTGTGEIPDGGPNAPPDYGTPLVVSFAVSGITGTLTSVRVEFTGTHSYVGDVDVVLAAPGGSPSIPVVSRIGVTLAGSFGDSSNYGGTYSFVDTAGSAAVDNIWSKALGTNGNPACTTDCIVPAGSYRTTAPGQAGQTSPAPVTNLTAAFAGLTPAQANGTWTLTFRDAGAVDTGTVTAANLEIVATAAPIPDSIGDFDGDGRTDYSVIRDGGTSTSQATWHISLNSNGNYISRNWGLGGDSFVPADIDGDLKDDIVVWRPGIQSTFYVINSLNNTIRIVDFGLASDMPTVIGDYNNDGRDDFAVYRPGATPGAQSYWYWASASNGALGVMDWGLNGDYPAPGDYDADGRMDFGVQRTSGGNSVFYRRYSSGIADTVTTFGNAGDFNVPGDYDGDGRTDLCVVGANGSLWQWTYRPSGGGADVVDTWGLVASDLPAPGDYNGDGRADYGVWRFDPQATFWVMRPVTHQIDSRQWGLSNDSPVTFSFVN